MNLAVITPEKTITYEDVSDISIPTPNGQKHIKNTSGDVDLVGRGKLTIRRRSKDGSQKNPETIEWYVNNGVMYVEKKVINIVTENIK